MGMTTTGENRERYAATHTYTDPRPSRFTGDRAYQAWAARADAWAKDPAYRDGLLSLRLDIATQAPVLTPARVVALWLRLDLPARVTTDPSTQRRLRRVLALLAALYGAGVSA